MTAGRRRRGAAALLAAAAVATSAWSAAVSATSSAAVPSAAPELATAAAAKRPDPDPPTVPRAVRPVDGALVRTFDPPATPYGPGHRGVDLAAPPGTRVRAALPGVVRFSGLVAGRGWVTVDHGGGLDTTYGVLDPRFVAAGDHVTAGAVLGRTAADARHLDWGARLRGDYIDPLGLLGAWRARLVPVT